ncbi:MAG: hydrogenase accessory protein HypB [Calditrichaeota bacterium]|nr:MAG: hydrogenase accessory protein HypB [Calditrichota bacterium]
MKTKIVKRSVLEENNRLAARLCEMARHTGCLVVNIMSSPGSGKTALLERTAEYLNGRYRIGCIAGDVETVRDAQRLQKAGIPTVPITTGGACHLEARMLIQPLQQMLDDGFQFVFIENVGNLICPSSYELGESLRVVLLSTTEGHDKPKKYPRAFHKAHLVVISKMDLVKVVDFDLEAAQQEIRELNPGVSILHLSAATGEGVKDWITFLERTHEQFIQSAKAN